MREQLEAAIEAAIETLNQLDGEPDFEPDNDDEPSLGWTVSGAGGGGRLLR